ncbi:methyl-accepting chemotaxis protein [Mycoplana sp. MJR14]|uniref:methyl-accepting chemotaxis protein n=1 Tax=Mycoplana sp. MJR14 TaxID=3032583 RepID=UPI0023D9B766|nr:methyl-accepting chemotaxis protein [Mycoplana sp. MJR14]MDF1632545.1 methyl-accepting chemotaxis protein [Mycoplana sp. MJR14]
MKTETKVARPLWMVVTGCGFAAVLFASSVIGGIGWHRQVSLIEQAVKDESQNDLGVLVSSIDAQQRANLGLAIAIAGQPGIVQMMKARDREGIVRTLETGYAQLKARGEVQSIGFADAGSTVIARVHDPEKAGDNNKGRRKGIETAVAEARPTSGIEPGKASIAIFGTAPVMDGTTAIGSADVGTQLTVDYFSRLAERINGAFSVYVAKDGALQRQAATYDGEPLVAIDELQAMAQGTAPGRYVYSGDRTLFVTATPLINFSGDTIGLIEAASDVTATYASGRSALTLSLLAATVTALLALAAFFLFARRLGNVIRRLNGTMTELAAGNLDAVVEGRDRRDELGAMANTVQVFKDNAVRTRQLERDAQEQRERTEDERRMTAAKEQDRSAAMAQATSGLATGLKHLASGDLSFRLDDPFAADFESLRADYNRAVDQLRQTLTAVANATNAIDSGSREISHSADDLSRRTEQQAASLEQTAAALDEITANVANSSKRAEEARAVAIQANESARQSGTVVANAVEAMSRIEQSSNQISNIIGVIDEIAFQTNLLALNAGVEAARAGEAGKGFAVVAQEVRELAQRSAQAAKEIKDLIRHSSGEVENGVQLVSQTGGALKTIEGYIVTINQHMDAIATSAREQSVGLSEVNTAVNQMDQVTQQNAAMVEESNAAGATLAMEAARLKERVEQFRLGGTAALPSGQRETSGRRAA